MSLVSPVVDNADANELDDRSGANDEVAGTSGFTPFKLPSPIGHSRSADIEQQSFELQQR